MSSLWKKVIKKHFKKATNNGLVLTQDFWNLAKPFLSNKKALYGNDITLAEGEKIIADDKKLVEVFIGHYINVVKTS